MRKELGTLLVVEDQPLAGSLLAQRLGEIGHTVTVCETGEQALELIASAHFDVVLLDIRLPGADGLSVLETIRRRHSPTALPVIMTTGFEHTEMIIRALELGASDYVTKPIDLAVLHARIQTQLSLRRMVHEREQLQRSLTEANERMKAELKAAASVQESLLPRGQPKIRGGHCAWAFEPCDELAGDTLNVFALDAEHLGMYVLDVSGHGVAASLLAVQVSRVLSPSADDTSVFWSKPLGSRTKRLAPPADVARALSHRFPFDADTNQFFTLVYGILNCRTGEFRFTCAGHPGPAWIPRSGEPRIVKAPGVPIGVEDGIYRDHMLRLLPGDRLYLYSDGLTDAMNGQREMFGPKQVLESLARRHDSSLDASLSGLLDDVKQWRAQARDDVSLVAVEYTGRPTKKRPPLQAKPRLRLVRSPGDADG